MIIYYGPVNIFLVYNFIIYGKWIQIKNETVKQKYSKKISKYLNKIIKFLKLLKLVFNSLFRSQKYANVQLFNYLF